MFERLKEWLRRRKQARLDARLFERVVIVRTDETGISAAHPNAPLQAIRWDEVQCIAIETNDSGPWSADVWWLVEGASTRCCYPQGATGEMEALKAIESRFAGFSHEAMIQAMGCTSNMRFVCWQRAAPDRTTSPRR
jgi:hypothetical protein